MTVIAFFTVPFLFGEEPVCQKPDVAPVRAVVPMKFSIDE